MAEPFLSEIRIFSFGFPPQGWALCNGQLLPINQNQALFSLLGTTYGGDGQRTFGLPDLQTRIPIHMGSSGGATHTLGERGGENAHTVLISELPAHNHLVNAIQAGAPASNAGHTPTTTKYLAQANAVVSGNTTDVNLYGTDQGQAFDATTISSTGGSQPHQNQQPYLVLNLCIALQGIFPSQT
ncbi:MAG TPA: tail fiber protein [Xanthobacteraceae bacterium]|nr:tail fiber protein [Xanthobacteraceae bacterium]